MVRVVLSDGLRPSDRRRSFNSHRLTQSRLTAMKSTTSLSSWRSIVVILLAVCRFSDAFDWKNHPNGKLVGSEVIFSVPRNVVFGTINGGRVAAWQYLLAARIRSYKLLYALANYCRYTIGMDTPGQMRSMMCTPTKAVIGFMKRHKTDVSDLEKLLNDTFSNPKYANADTALTLLLLLRFEDGVYDLLFSDVKTFNILVLRVLPNEHFDGRLAEAIKAWTFFDNLADDEESVEYVPANFQQNCMYPAQYFYGKIIGEHVIMEPEKGEAEQGNEKKKEEKIEIEEVYECSVM